MTKKLPDPDRCPKCRRVGRVVDSRRRNGYRRRRHRCAMCKVSWPSYETIVHPRDQVDALLGVY